MPHKGKCADCQCSLFECKSKEVKELPCKHYCHSSCIVVLHEEEVEVYCLTCRHNIPRDWLKKIVDEIKEQQRIDEGVDYKEFYSRFSLTALDTINDHFSWLQGSIGKHGINCNSENFRNFVEYMGMLQKVLTLVQQLEDNDRKGEKNNLINTVQDLCILAVCNFDHF